jgi:molybdenum cofactor guanylyltransferase
MADSPAHSGLNTTGLILAGGQGLRMGGADKGLQLLNGQPLVAHVHARLLPQVGRVMISANRNTQQYAAFAPVVADAVAGFVGPLAGVQAGLAACTTPYLLVVPCDAPLLPLNLAHKLLQTLEAAHAPAAFAQVRDAMRPQPVFCLLHTHLQETVATALAPPLSTQVRRGSMLDFLLRVGAAPCMFEDVQAFANINDAQMLAGFERTTRVDQ